MGSAITYLSGTETTEPLTRGEAAGGVLQLEMRSSSERARALKQWRALEQRIGAGSLLCSADWTEAWLAHFGDLVPHRFVIGRRGARTCGICLLTDGVQQKDGPFAVRSLHVGTAGEPDADSVCVEYNRLLVEEESQAEFLQQLVSIVSTEASWDEFRLDGFACSDADRALAGCADFQYRRARSYFHDLAAARDAGRTARDQLGFSTRKNIRKNLNAYGTPSGEWAETADEADEMFEEMVRLHQARWTSAGEPGSFASRRFYAFHKELMQRLVPQGRAGMFRVRSGAETIGCVQLYIDRNRALCYQGGSAAYVGKRSPGMIVDSLCMEECLRRGFDAYDFLCGESHHKQKLSTHWTELVWASLRRPRAKFLVLAAGRRIKRAAARAWALRKGAGGNAVCEAVDSRKNDE